MALTTQPQQASFSCMIDGQAFSSSGSDGMTNAAFRNAPDMLSVGLVSMDPKYKGTIPPQISLVFSPATTTVIKGNAGKYTASYAPPNQANNSYYADLVTVTITSLTATRITGTFSGKLSLSTTPGSITITDGKFDLPASKYSKSLK
jgi:hypothetical protein